MYCVVLIKCLDEQLPTKANRLPVKGQVLGNLFDTKDPDEELFSYEKAIQLAEEYNNDVLHRLSEMSEIQAHPEDGDCASSVKPDGTWAIVQRDDWQVVSGTLVELRNANSLN